MYLGKTGELIVDYTEIKKEILDTLKTYTNSDQHQVQENEEAKRCV